VTEIKQVKNKRRGKSRIAAVSRLNVSMFTAAQLEQVLSHTTSSQLNIHQFCAPVNTHTHTHTHTVSQHKCLPRAV